MIVLPGANVSLHLHCPMNWRMSCQSLRPSLTRPILKFCRLSDRGLRIWWHWAARFPPPFSSPTEAGKVAWPSRRIGSTVCASSMQLAFALVWATPVKLVVVAVVAESGSSLEKRQISNCDIRRSTHHDRFQSKLWVVEVAPVQVAVRPCSPKQKKKR